MPTEEHPIVWLEHAGQRLGLLPTFGGSVAAWQLLRPQGPLDLWRPWDGVSPDRYTFASFPLVPWSNRISGGGFEHQGRFHPIQPNRVAEPYPIHGDGWLQAWSLTQPAANVAELRLASRHLDGRPGPVELARGETPMWRVHWHVDTRAPAPPAS
jgi:aldose 1-epimerase